MKIGVIMDPLASVHVEKDTTMALMLAASHRGHALFYIAPDEIWLENGIVWAQMTTVTVHDDPLDEKDWVTCGEVLTQPLVELDCVLLRKDPPFDQAYLYLTYLLDLAQENGVLVVNDPTHVRTANEKLFAMQFPQCCPKTLVSSRVSVLLGFLAHTPHVVLKPLNAMGGYGVLQLRRGDENTRAVLQLMTANETCPVMLQAFVPAVYQGDKRILIVHGEPVPMGLVRVPVAGDFRGNLAQGAQGHVAPLTERDYWICEQIIPTLNTHALRFVGIDVVGDYLTEINVTSPTGVREIERDTSLTICDDFLAGIEAMGFEAR